MHADTHLMLKEAIATAKAFTQELPEDPLAATMQILGIGCEQSEQRIKEVIAVCKYSQEQEAKYREKSTNLAAECVALNEKNRELVIEIERLDARVKGLEQEVQLLLDSMPIRSGEDEELYQQQDDDPSF